MKRLFLWVLAALVIGFGGYWVLVVASAGLPDVRGLAKRVPPRTSMMRAREAEARREGRDYRVDQRWVPYGRISPLLRNAVLIAEDDAFFSHEGLDWDQLGEAARKNLSKRKVIRGGSTITQQLAKNLYLGEERTITRKLREVILAKRLEGALTKKRIFELYLNLIEWGDGIFGAEAAARRHFGVSAAGLDARQAALLAAVIINPRQYSPKHPGVRIQRRERLILSRMHRRGLLTDDQYAVAIGKARPRLSVFEWMFGIKSKTPESVTPEPEPAPEEAPGDTSTAVPDTAAAPAAPP